MKCLSEPIAKRGNRKEDVIHIFASMNLDSQAIVRLARNNDGNAVDVRFKYKLRNAVAIKVRKGGSAHQGRLPCLKCWPFSFS